VKTEHGALAIRERGTLVEKRVFEEVPSSESWQRTQCPGLKRQDPTDRSNYGSVHQSGGTSLLRM
jgi:hypothetical protein